MSGFWRGYANVNDDLRHTWEQVAYGRKTTGDLTANEVPGMVTPTAQEAAQPSPDAAATPVDGQAKPPHEHADLYERIWGPAPTSPEPTGGATPGTQPTQDTTPKIEGPAIEPPRQGGDLTPG